MGWLEDGSYEGKAANLGMIGIAGIAIGSSLGSKAILMNGKNNVNRVIIFFNIMAMLANGMKMFQNYYVILIARFLFGCFCGACNIAYGKILSDTVPNSVNQIYGLLVNIGFCSGLLAS